LQSNVKQSVVLEAIMKSARAHLCRVLILLAVVALLPSAFSQTAETPNSVSDQKTAVIRFFADVNPTSVGILLQTIDTQYKMGTRKFVLLMSSGGGDLLSGFMAYNYLKGLPIEVTTFNVGNVDSSASIIYCAGSTRYAVPEARFVIHEVSLSITSNGPGTMNIDLPSLDSQITLLRSQETSMARILATAVKKPEADAEARIHAQKSLSADEAKKWGLVQDIRTELFDPNSSTLVMAVPPSLPIINSNPLPVIPTVPAFSSGSLSTSAN